MEDKEGIQIVPSATQELSVPEEQMSPLDQKKLGIARLDPHDLYERINKLKKPGEEDQEKQQLLKYAERRYRTFLGFAEQLDIDKLEQQAAPMILTLEEKQSGTLKYVEAEKGLEYVFERMKAFEHTAGQNPSVIETIMSNNTREAKNPINSVREKEIVIENLYLSRRLNELSKLRGISPNSLRGELRKRKKRHAELLIESGLIIKKEETVDDSPKNRLKKASLRFQANKLFAEIEVLKALK